MNLQILSGSLSQSFLPFKVSGLLYSKHFCPAPHECWAQNPVRERLGQHVQGTAANLFVAGGLPTLSFLLFFLWLVCWLVQPAWLVVCLGLEKTHTVMDGSWTGRKMLLFGALVCWFACRDCLRDTVLDGYAMFLFVCLDGWMDAVQIKAGGGTGEGAALRDGWFWLLGLLVAWLVCWLGHVVAWLVGRLVGTPLMDGCMHACMDGWMDPVLPHVPEASESVSGVSRRSGQSLCSFRRVPKG